MSLNKDDFTEEQWKEIEAATDRARTAASDTARKNALRDAEAETTAKITAAVAEDRENAKKGEQERLEAERAKFEVERKALAVDKRGLIATKKLLAGGLTEEDIEPLVPLFTGLDDSVFTTSIDAFLKLHNDTVKKQVDSVKQDLLNNATPPPRGGNAPVDANAAAAEALKSGDEAGAIEALLNASGNVPTQ